MKKPVSESTDGLLFSSAMTYTIKHAALGVLTAFRFFQSIPSVLRGAAPRPSFSPKGFFSGTAGWT
jgi:hypothetical protein